MSTKLFNCKDTKDTIELHFFVPVYDYVLHKDKNMFACSLFSISFPKAIKDMKINKDQKKLTYMFTKEKSEYWTNIGKIDCRISNDNIIYTFEKETSMKNSESKQKIYNIVAVNKTENAKKEKNTCFEGTNARKSDRQYCYHKLQQKNTYIETVNLNTKEKNYTNNKIRNTKTDDEYTICETKEISNNVKTNTETDNECTSVDTKEISNNVKNTETDNECTIFETKGMSNNVKTNTETDNECTSVDTKVMSHNVKNMETNTKNAICYTNQQAFYDPKYDLFFADESDSESDKNSLESLFLNFYKNASAESKRAMNKSYIESNGTVLTSCWSDVCDKNVDPVYNETEIIPGKNYNTKHKCVKNKKNSDNTNEMNKS